MTTTEKKYNFDAFPALKEMTELEATEILWRRGVLHWKLDSAQKKLYNKYKRNDHKVTVWNCSRQIGKSFTLITLALETCLSTPNCQVKYCAGQAKAVGKILRPTLRKILQECPKDIRPSFNRIEGCYNFNNGSILYIEGLDGGKADDLRGTPANLIIVDEAGFVDDLEYAVNAVLLPMTSTTKGRILIVSSPPKSASHDLVDFIKKAQFDNAYIKMSIYEYLEQVKSDPAYLRDRLAPEEVERLRKVTKPNDWKREYLCEIVTNEEYSVIPEFTNELESEIVHSWIKPPRFDTYVSMDLGVKDFTAILFAYYDFRNAKLVVEDELLFNGQQARVSTIANAIIEKEKELWTDPKTNKVLPVTKRIADNNEQIALNEMISTYELSFALTRKDEKSAALNDFRDRIANKQIIINPKCKNFIFQLKNATWAKNKKSYDRSPEGGHYDLIDAAIYLVRNIDWRKNPYPRNYGLSKDTFYRNINDLTETAQVIKDIFIKKK